MQQLSQVFAAPLARSRGAQFGNRCTKHIFDCGCMPFLHSKIIGIGTYSKNTDFIIVIKILMFCEQYKINHSSV